MIERGRVQTKRFLMECKAADISLIFKGSSLYQFCRGKESLLKGMNVPKKMDQG